MSYAKKHRVSNTKVVSRVPEILRLCANKRILHIGCSDAPFTKEKGDELLHKKLSLITGSDMLWGLDISAEGVELMQEMGFDNIIYANAEDVTSNSLKEQSFDIVLAAEVIEHVDNPGLFLESLRSFMSENSELVITTTNATSFRQSIHALLREEKVHTDHNYYFSYRTIKQLVEKFGMDCREIYYYQEQAPNGIGKFGDRILSASTWISPIFSDGVIARAVLSNS